MVSQSEGYFTSIDGLPIYYKIFTPKSTAFKARLLSIHGLGEHISRYDKLFTEFAEAGILVRGLDTRGHGKTYEKQAQDPKYNALKGYNKSCDLVYQDLLLLNELELLEGESDLPTFLFGHSLGGMMILDFTVKHAQQLKNFKGVIASAPALKANIPMYVKLAVNLNNLSFVARYTDSNKLDRNGICSDEEEMKKYNSDPLIHDRISLQLVGDIIKITDSLQAKAAEFNFPFLICHSPADSLIPFEGSLTFFDNAKNCQDKTLTRFDGSKHELHFEPSPVKEKVSALYQEWILKRATVQLSSKI